MSSEGSEESSGILQASGATVFFLSLPLVTHRAAVYLYEVVLKSVLSDPSL